MQQNSFPSKSEIDFDIFQEEMIENKNLNKETIISAANSNNKENNSNIIKSDDKKVLAFDEYDCQEHIYVNDEYEEDDENDVDEEEEDQELDDEEEGISRLNLIAVVDNSNESIAEKSEYLNISDYLTHSDLSSPMALDDTIKFQSILSSNLDDNETSHILLNDHGDLDEEALRKSEAIERENILMNCNDYREDILAYMRELEQDNRPKVNYMKKQQDISSSMRSILIDWLVEVSEEYKLNMETLYLAVNYTDRFLSQMSVLRGKLQLVGTAAMYIASKYEEITPPDISEFVYITDDTYTKKQVLRMEHLLLKILDFKMNSPTANWFLLYYLRFIKPLLGSSNNQRVEFLARYLAELSLIDGETFLTYLPSQIAASAVYLSLYTLGKPWTKQISEILGYNYDLNELKPCIIHLYKAMQQAPNHPQQAIQEKYKQAKYDYVSLIEAPKSLASI